MLCKCLLTMDLLLGMMASGPNSNASEKWFLSNSSNSRRLLLVLLLVLLHQLSVSLEGQILLLLLLLLHPMLMLIELAMMLTRTRGHLLERINTSLWLNKDSVIAHEWLRIMVLIGCFPCYLSFMSFLLPIVCFPHHCSSVGFFAIGASFLPFSLL